MRAWGSVAIGFTSALLTLLALLYALPPIDDYRLDNPFWNGMSKIAERFHVSSLTNGLAGLRLLDPEKSTLLIIGPSKGFDDASVETIRSFLRDGGRVVIADDFGSGNEVIEKLGLRPRFNGSLLVDPLFKGRSMKIPMIRDFSPETPLNSEVGIFFNYATVIEGCYEALARSSSFSFLDLDMDGEYDKGEPKGPFTVMCRIKYGEGILFLIADSSVFINAMVDMGENTRLFRYLTSGRRVVVDVDHWDESTIAVFKRDLKRALTLVSGVEGRYLITALVLIVLSRAKLRPKGVVVSNVEKVLSRNPTWDRKVLERLEGDMVVE